MRRSRLAAAAALLLCRPPALPAQEVVAVVGAAPWPYQAAFDAFAAGFGRPFTTIRLPRRPSSDRPGTRVVVAFGSEAVLLPHPEGAVVIACLAPGIAERMAAPRRVTFLEIKPAPARLLSEMRRVQPGLTRLAVLSQGRDAARYLIELRRAGEAIGVAIVAVRVPRPEDVPDALRTLLPGQVDAIWLAPEPRLVTPAAFQTILQFSWDNRLPFYAPSRGLAAAGAAAAVAVPPEEIGRLAGELARRALDGETLPERVYPERTQLTVNPASALKAGLAIPPAALGPGDEVLP